MAPCFQNQLQLAKSRNKSSKYLGLALRNLDSFLFSKRPTTLKISITKKINIFMFQNTTDAKISYNYRNCYRNSKNRNTVIEYATNFNVINKMHSLMVIQLL